jgi:hypothetical protein
MTEINAIRPEHEIALKQALGANDVRHSGRTLFAHLKGTYELLVSWGANEDAQLAGLFHSVYGTKFFKHQCLEPTEENRALVVKLIGERAERLVHAFCFSEQPNFDVHLTERDFSDLRLIAKANLREQQDTNVVRPR